MPESEAEEQDKLNWKIEDSNDKLKSSHLFILTDTNPSVYQTSCGYFRPNQRAIRGREHRHRRLQPLTRTRPRQLSQKPKDHSHPSLRRQPRHPSRPVGHRHPRHHQRPQQPAPRNRFLQRHRLLLDPQKRRRIPPRHPHLRCLSR